MTTTKIEWTDCTWNPVVGCSIHSPGCKHCYAMPMAARIEWMNPGLAHYRGLTQPSNGGPVWTGKVVPAPDNIFLQPLRWKKPRRIFVNSMSDLFHEDVPDAAIDRIFAIMALTPQHTYQVLTKWAARMRRYFGAPHPSGNVRQWQARVSGAIDDIMRFRTLDCVIAKEAATTGNALPNVWLGVSAERQEEADERIPHLLETPAAKRFVSAEPLLGPIDLMGLIDADRKTITDALQGIVGTNIGTANEPEWDGASPCARLDWVIAGGESGPGARPAHPDWFRALRDQCQAAGVPFFFKQWGEWLPGENYFETRPAGPARWQDGETGQHSTCRDKAESRTPEWRHWSKPGDPGVFHLRVGKKAAGALLDGREWREMPR